MPSHRHSSKHRSSEKKNSKKTSSVKKSSPVKKTVTFSNTVTKLRQSDFARGTYRITRPGKYVVVEDITFEPNADNDYRPYKGDKNYTGLGFSLGFFAAITIETSNVELDLDGHKIEQSKVFALAQRFFAIIELASAPFIPGQGPGNFGPKVDSAHNCLIHNGTLGRSSHHGIHGNLNTNIIIKDLVVKDFEVGGIAINSLVGGELKDLTIGPGSKEVHVLGNFSAARFMRQFYEQAYYSCLQNTIKGLDKATAHSVDRCNIDWSYLNRLEAEVNKVLRDIKYKGKIDSKLFGNKTLLPDGNNYGLLVNVTGVAVNDYVEEDFNGKYSDNIRVENVDIKHMKVKVNEIVAISDKDGKGAQTDSSGSVIQILEIKNNNGTAKHNVLADAQFYLAKYAHEHGLIGKIGKLNIDKNLIDWYYGKISWNKLMSKGYKLKCNGDSMFHVNKGTHGIRMDGVRNSSIKNINIYDIQATGNLGNERVDGAYEKSHTLQERLGYHGADITAGHFSHCKNVTCTNVKIKDVHSDNGEARGMRLINQCNAFMMNDITIENLTAGYKYKDGRWYGVNYDGKEVEYTASYPNIVPNAIGVFEDANSKMTLNKHSINGLKAPGCAVPVWSN